MQNRQRMWFFCALCFLLVSLSFGVWGLSQFLFVQHSPDNRTREYSTSSTQVVSSSVLDMSNAHLIIPSIQLDAPVEQVGLTATGAMDVPTKDQWGGVGWYNKGSLPGTVGSAVIDGHLDKPGGLPAVFWNLRNLHLGDLVTVQDKEGHTKRFRVTKMANYAPDQAPLDEIFSNKDGSFLNLITCAGRWVPSQHQTTLRLVVYTTLVE
ncbi:class F sortase [Tengunoibacter tsumagoiensis]|uniref:Class F sortase n=1 Tax=Tengunoibacter tsumagoiensis TaxID=2014871 RepID=A0A401ZVI2_9CHLR|nr:class F sortase [Tengunoibacter tsumagoiensis]GCE10802.1 hypothetical protein KTT_06610 [Tengunoibacter tsumagoiensis]